MRFKDMDIAPGARVEVNVPTHALGVMGADDSYYGVGFCGKVLRPIKGTPNNILRVQVLTSGFYGMSDSCEAPVAGNPVIVFIDGIIVKHAEWRNEQLRITL